MITRTVALTIILFWLPGCAASGTKYNLRDLSQRKVSRALSEVFRRALLEKSYEVRLYISIAPTLMSTTESDTEVIEGKRRIVYEINYSDNTIDSATLAVVTVASLNEGGQLEDMHSECWVWSGEEWHRDVDYITRRKTLDVPKAE